mmetsp:Transcript_23065/g.37951  ORF Transcript_23065/g.37951 Transcript_23065/m.37951 type:complete len:89 (-) Transcript_23065:323-589(-)
MTYRVSLTNPRSSLANCIVEFASSNKERRIGSSTSAATSFTSSLKGRGLKPGVGIGLKDLLDILLGEQQRFGSIILFVLLLRLAGETS